MPEFGKIVVFGTGLIGGSFALALKEANAVEEEMVLNFLRHKFPKRCCLGF